ncbi:hypothetical protein BS50DRAFT_136877 [Corynespora cassiicola Philippines]|uniref:Uncharacterized protein n=1 Tax=Corynespora cassiicola Philippines TaxID=1448308 RepID=A0A2T2N9I7_CORCC|nr:hypothetical protein BS50DRAFT_136877 [Corynespora cassiicola Philippines]
MVVQRLGMSLENIRRLHPCVVLNYASRYFRAQYLYNLLKTMTGLGTACAIANKMHGQDLERPMTK